uniref:Twin-arginine translocation signal domain-containing protein n=1 Tax=Mus musculus TaxID=10090 RepID=Q9D9L3_MOUSE|nr:unnamed protein product [Mus musculus]
MAPRGELRFTLRGSRADQLREGAHTRGRKMAARGRPEVTRRHFLQNSGSGVGVAAHAQPGAGPRLFLSFRPAAGREQHRRAGTRGRRPRSWERPRIDRTVRLPVELWLNQSALWPPRRASSFVQ